MSSRESTFLFAGKVDDDDDDDQNSGDIRAGHGSELEHQQQHGSELTTDQEGMLDQTDPDPRKASSMSMYVFIMINWSDHK